MYVQVLCETLHLFKKKQEPEEEVDSIAASN